MILSIIFLSFLTLLSAQPPPAWDLRVDHQRGDNITWGSAIQGRVCAHMQVVAGVADDDQRQPLLSWKLPRDMDRGCVGVGFELEVMRDA